MVADSNGQTNGQTNGQMSSNENVHQIPRISYHALKGMLEKSENGFSCSCRCENTIQCNIRIHSYVLAANTTYLLKLTGRFQGVASNLKLVNFRNSKSKWLHSKLSRKFLSSELSNFQTLRLRFVDGIIPSWHWELGKSFARIFSRGQKIN